MKQSKDIRIIIVDDHMVVRKGLVHVLDRAAGISIVAEADSGEKAVSLCHTLKPDMIIMDIKMEGIGGLEATRLIAQHHPSIHIVGLSTFADQYIINKMFDLGAHGYLLKDVSAQILTESIFRIHSGEKLSPTNLCKVENSDIPEDIGKKFNEPEARMGKQQQKVLVLISKGFTNPEISSHLNISLPTTKYHVSAILQKLDVSNRSEAVALAVRNNLIDENIL